MGESFKIKGYEFRVARMNAIETLALQTQLSYDTYDKAEKTIECILTHLEVNVQGTWTRVKEGNVYCPASIETDVDFIRQLIEAFTVHFLQPLFTSSDVSKQSQAQILSEK